MKLPRGSKRIKYGPKSFFWDRYGTNCEVINFHFSIVPISFGAVWGSMLGGHWCFLVLFGVSCLGSCLSSSKSFSAKYFAAPPKPILSSGRNLKLTPPLPVGGLCMDSVLKQWFRPSGGQIRTPTQLRPKPDPTPTQVRPNPTQLRPKSDPSLTETNPNPAEPSPSRTPAQWESKPNQII